MSGGGEGRRREGESNQSVFFEKNFLQYINDKN